MQYFSRITPPHHHSHARARARAGLVVAADGTVAVQLRPKPTVREPPPAPREPATLMFTTAACHYFVNLNVVVVTSTRRAWRAYRFLLSLAHQVPPHVPLPALPAPAPLVPGCRIPLPVRVLLIGFAAIKRPNLEGILCFAERWYASSIWE